MLTIVVTLKNKISKNSLRVIRRPDPGGLSLSVLVWCIWYLLLDRTREKTFYLILHDFKLMTSFLVIIMLLILLI